MRWTTCFCLSLLSFCCLASLQWTFAAVTSAAEPVTAEVEETTDGASPEKWEYPRMCYIEKSKVDELIVQMNSTVRVLNRDDEYLECREKLKIVEADNMEICTEERIREVQKDLFEVAGSLFKLAVRLTEPAEEEVKSLDLKKIRLIHDLNALLVFYGPSPCNSHSIVLFPFASLVEHLEWNLAQILVLFQTPRPTRRPPPTTPAPSTTTSKPTVEDMLNSEKSLNELKEMARLNPAAVSKAVPQIVSQRYNERPSTFEKLLTFVQGLPTNENKIFGFAAIHDEMYRYKRNPDVHQLLKLKEIMNSLNASFESASPNFAGSAASLKLSDLIQDLSSVQTTVATTTSTTQKPIFDRLHNPEKSLAELTEMAELDPTAMTKAIPQIISQRYNERNSTFNALLTFVRSLPTIENQVFGFAAVYDEMHRYIRNPEYWKLAELAESVKRLNQSESTDPNFTDKTAHEKLVDLIHDLNPITAAMATTSAPTTTTAKPKPSLDEMLNPEKSFAELIKLAESNPSLMSKAVPQIVSQRYNERPSTFEKLVTFVQGLPTNENKIFSFAAIHNEMYRYKRNPDIRQLLELKEIVHRLNVSFESASQNSAGAAASEKLADLIQDLSSVQTTVATTTSTTQKPILDRMLNPEKSFAELIGMAESNPSLMAKALPKIVSQRYSRRVSTFDNLLDFVNAMPTMENKIFGFSAVYDEMHGHNQKPEELQLEKLAKHVKRIIDSAPTTLNAVAISKMDELAEDPDLCPLIFLLSPEKTLQEFAKCPQPNPSVISTALPEIISARYNASAFQFEAILNFVDGLPTTENKIIGFVAVHDQMHRHNQTTNLAQLLKLTKKVTTLNEDEQTALALERTTEEQKWTNLIHNLSPLLLIGEKAVCEITNVAYRTQLIPRDVGLPNSAYVFQDQSYKRTFQIYPAIQNNKLVFRLGVNAPFFASDTNTNTDPKNTKYQTKTSERYVLWDRPSSLPSAAEINWKIVAVPNKVNQFRILSGKSDDFMFAHKSATAWSNSLRRVLLGRKSYSDHDHIPNADLWTFDCEPGTFDIPSI